MDTDERLFRLVPMPEHGARVLPMDRASDIMGFRTIDQKSQPITQFTVPRIFVQNMLKNGTISTNLRKILSNIRIF